MGGQRRRVQRVPTISGVVFDLDGTLFDHHLSARLGLRAWLGARGVALDDELERAWFEAEARHFAAWRDGLVSFAEQRRRRLRDFLPLVGVRDQDDDLDGVFAGYLDAYERAWVGYDDVNSALASLRDLGLTTAVLTNGSEHQQRAKLSRLGLLNRVGPVFTAGPLGVAKPRPEAFHLVCRALDLAPSSVLYVGDDYEVDVVAARSAGLQAIHLDRYDAGPHTEPRRISTLADLHRLMP